MERIVNPFAGIPTGWGWTAHRVRGYFGGTDYKTSTGQAITAAASGIAYKINDHEIHIRLADGRRIVYLELRSTTGSFPREVSVGSRIAYAGYLGKWAHIHALSADGVRIPFEPLVKAYRAHLARARKRAIKRRIKTLATYLNARPYGYKTAASRTGIRGPIYFRLLQTWGKRAGVYSGKVNGTKTAETLRLETLLQHHIDN